MKRLKNWDNKILKKYPVIWTWGLHIYLPALLLGILLMYCLGLLYPVSVRTVVRYMSQSVESMSKFAIIPSLIAAVLFFMRQVKFNGIRVHHNVPYQKPLKHFFVFFVVFFLITALPLAYTFGVYHKAKLSLDEDEYLEDLSALNKGYSHFYQSNSTGFIKVQRPNPKYEMELQDSIEHAQAHEGWENDTVQQGPCPPRHPYTPRYVSKFSNDSSVAYCNYRYDSDIDKLILNRDKFSSRPVPHRDWHFLRSRSSSCSVPEVYSTDYEDYAEIDYSFRLTSWDTISREVGLQEIRDFMLLAEKYQLNLKAGDPKQIMANHLTKARKEFSYNLSDNDESGFNHFHYQSRRNDLGKLFDVVVEKNGVFNSTRPQFWFYYIAFSLALSLLLYIVCATKIRDFAWAILAAALTSMVFGVIAGGFKINSEEGIMALVFCFVMIYLIVMFSKVTKPGLSKAFTIAFHAFFPILIGLVFAFFDIMHSCPYFGDDLRYCLCDNYEYFDERIYWITAYLCAILGGILSVWLFNKIYKKKYVNPRES